MMMPWPKPLTKNSHWSSIFSVSFSFIFFLTVTTALTSIPPPLKEPKDPLLSPLLSNGLAASKVLSPLLITARTDPFPLTLNSGTLNLDLLLFPALEKAAGDRLTAMPALEEQSGLTVNIFVCTFQKSESESL